METDGDRLVAGRYRLEKQIGRGGMGTVWVAEDGLLDRRVAVKKLRLPPQLPDDERARLLERTRREARSAARISHPNVIVVHDVVEDEGLPCIVMEYVPARSLSDILKADGPLSDQLAIQLAVTMTSALQAAHAAGVLHRDVKPANVLLSEDGERTVLTDFGIAAASDTATLTQTGEFVGSMAYTAPERFQGGESGPAADVWALGATLYEAVEGRPPFVRDTWMETAYATATEPPPAMQRAGELAPLLERLLAKEPTERPDLTDTETLLRQSREQQPDETPTVRRGAEGGADTATTVGAAGAVAGPGRAAAGPDGASAGPEPAAATGPGADGAAANHPSSGAGSPAAPEGAAADAAPPGATQPADTADTTSQAAAQPASGRRSGRRRGLRTVLWCVVAVVLAGGAAAGGWWAAQDSSSRAAEPPQGGNSPRPSGPSASPRPSTPAGFHRVTDPAGFSADVPDNWQRKVNSDGSMVTYVSPSGLTALQFSVLDFADTTPVRHWRNLEPEVRAKSPGYERLRLNATRYQGGPAALWEYTWNGRARTFRAIDLGWGEAGKQQYAVYLSAPKAAWQRSRPFFDTATASFRATG